MGLNWRFITNFGDTIVIIPCVTFILVWLLLHKDMRKMACYVFFTFISLTIITAFTKILFQAFGFGSKTLNFTGVSGHSILSAFLWPFLFYCSIGFRDISAGFMFFIGVALSSLIGFGLLITQSHSCSEVALGLFLGWGVAIFLIKKFRPLYIFPLGFSAFLVFISLLIASTELRAPTYHFFREVSKFLSDDGKVKKRKELYGSNIKS